MAAVGTGVCFGAWLAILAPGPEWPGLCLRSEVIEDQQVEAIKPMDGCLQRQFAARDLKPLHQIGCASEHYAQPFSTNAKPMAETRCVLPPPGPPTRIRLPPLSIQLLPAQIAMTRALEIIGTTSKSELSSVLPGSSGVPSCEHKNRANIRMLPAICRRTQRP